MKEVDSRRRSTISPRAPLLPRATLFRKVYVGWCVITASLVLDPFIVWMTPGTLPYPLSLWIATCSAIATLPFLAQGVFHRALHTLRSSQRELAKQGKNHAVFIILSLMALIASSKLALTQGLQLLPAVILSAFIVIGIIRAVLQMASQIRKDNELFIKNPKAQVARWEEQLLALSLLPMIIARGVSLLGALTLHPAGDVATALPWFLIPSLLLLGMLKPLPKFYSGFCPKCKHPVSIVVVSLGCCERCEQPRG